MTLNQFFYWLNRKHPGAVSLIRETPWGFFYSINGVPCACIYTSTGIVSVGAVNLDSFNTQQTILGARTQYAPSLKSLAHLIHIEIE